MWLQQALREALKYTSPPGYIYAFAYSLAAVLMVFSNPKRMQGISLWAVQGGFVICNAAINLLLNTGKELLFLPTLFLTLCLVFLQILAGAKIPTLNIVYFTLYSFALGEMFASLQGYLFYINLPSNTDKTLPVYVFLSIFLVFGLLFLAGLLLLRRFRQGNLHLRVRSRTVLQEMIIVLGMYLISNVSNYRTDLPFSGIVPRDILLIRALADLGCVMMLYAFHLHLLELDRELETRMLRQLVRTQYSNYQMERQTVALVQQKYHDLKHQIAYLRDGLSNDEKLHSLQRMEDEIRSFEALADTGNSVLDTILTAKHLQCMDQSIVMNCLVDGQAVDFIEAMDLAALFGNALDNAIEGVSELPSGQSPRLIDVYVGRKKGFVLIRIGNSCTEQIRFENSLPRTTKDDGSYHGFGTKSILATAGKYGGSAFFTEEDGWFELNIVIPSNK